MDARIKLDVVRGVLAAFNDDARRSLLYREEEALEKVAVAAIRGVITADDAIPEPPTPPKPVKVTASQMTQAMTRRKIDAIKALRDRGSTAGVEGLKDAKEAVEAVMAVFADSAQYINENEDMPF